MELFKSGDIKPECVKACPTFGQCRQIALAALAMKLEANSVLRPTGVDFVDENTGEYISEAEYFGATNLSHEAAQMLYEGGVKLASAAESYRDILAKAGCEGPQKITDEFSICTGWIEVKKAISETVEDLEFEN